ncbi:MAG: hypothetical protein II705_01425 [Clostridia bacterium]|jgi:hypothetical protein|nr:hypothetical protein [Clostridia bacterium]MBQ1435516.1 hypothetical protein [Clostridia bacterium]MBQ4248678.1 hypothetical protein [Clostridia bacterium]
MDEKVRIVLSLTGETMSAARDLACELGLTAEEVMELLIERSLFEKKLSNHEKNMIKGYAYMGTINTQMAEEAVAFDNEAQLSSEEYLAGV